VPIYGAKSSEKLLEPVFKLYSLSAKSGRARGNKWQDVIESFTFMEAVIEIDVKNLPPAIANNIKFWYNGLA
jgi:hypothetical protein